jgi:hypothetical protein
MKLLLAVVPLLLLAGCGARVASIADSGSHDGDAGQVPPASDAGTPRDAGSTTEAETSKDAAVDCGQPSAPTYDCTPTGDEPVDGGTCFPYDGGGESKHPTYPLGCTVTTTTCDLNFGGPLTCNCQHVPGMDAGPTWLCPL